MGIISRVFQRPDPPVEGAPPRREVTLHELAEQFEIVEAGPNAIIVSDPHGRGFSSALDAGSELDFRELGVTGTTSWRYLMRDEYNPELKGWLGLHKYDQMRRSDATVRSSLRVFKTPILGGRWFIAPAGTTRHDELVAQFVSDALFKYMTISWPQLLSEILLMLDFGHYMTEKVWMLLPNGRVTWQKLAPRHPMDVAAWHWDANGGPQSVDLWTDSPIEVQNVDIHKLLIFTHDREAGNLEGISLLRSAYKHWYFKENLYKIDAIQKERHGIGVPIIKLPPGFKVNDKKLADEMGRNLRTNEKAHIVLPPNWEVMTLKLEGQPVDVVASIDHHNREIWANVLAPWMAAERFSTIDQYLALYQQAVRYVADIVRDIFNKYAIPQLVMYNWANEDNFPELRARRIGETQDWRTLSFALRNLIGAKALTPDEKLEEWLRNEMDAPPADPESARTPDTPQAPGAPKPKGPRQSQAQNQRGGTGNNGNVGQDKSGGK